MCHASCRGLCREHTRSIAPSQARQGFQHALGFSRPRALKSVAGPSASPSNSSGSDSPTRSGRCAGGEQGARSSPLAWDWFGALPGDAQGAREEQGRGTSGGNDAVGRALLGGEWRYLGLSPWFCLRRMGGWLQRHVQK